MVYAAAGTSARDSLAVRISRDAAQLGLAETWTDSSLAQWLPFGSPPPSLGKGPNGEGVFLNNGEGSFESGLLSRRAFSASGGIAVDLRFSSPTSLAQWQLLATGIREEPDTTRYRSAVGRNAHPRADARNDLCVVAFPQEGRVSGLAPLLSLRTDSHRRRPPPRLRRRAHRYRLDQGTRHPLTPGRRREVRDGRYETGVTNDGECPLSAHSPSPVSKLPSPVSTFTHARGEAP